MAAKLSGLNTATADPLWTAADLRPAVEVALASLGPERLLCGSDWPVALLNGDYARVWRETRRLVGELAPGHARELLDGTARRIYRLGDNGREPTPAHSSHEASRGSD